MLPLLHYYICSDLKYVGELLQHYTNCNIFSLNFICLHMPLMLKKHRRFRGIETKFFVSILLLGKYVRALLYVLATYSYNTMIQHRYTGLQCTQSIYSVECSSIHLTNKQATLELTNCHLKQYLLSTALSITLCADFKLRF